MTDGLRPELRGILDSARSEVKRWGCDLGYLHVAIVLARRWPEEFTAAFGAIDRNQLENLLLAHTVAGDEAGVVALLERSNGPSAIDALATELRAALTDVIDISHGVPSSTPAMGPATGLEPVSPLAAHEDTSSAEASGEHVEERSARFVKRVLPASFVREREGVVADVLSRVGALPPQPVILVGPRGGGRSAIADALAVGLEAARLPVSLQGASVGRVDAAEVLLADAGRTLERIFEDTPSTTILFLDDVDVLVGLGGHPDLYALRLLRAAVTSRRRLVLTASDGALTALETHDPELLGRLAVVRLRPLSQSTLEDVVASEIVRLTKEMGVSMDLTLALESLGAKPELVHHPGLALSLLHQAAGRAAMRPDGTVYADDLMADGPAMTTVTAETLAERLRNRVVGQSHAVEAVSQRLSLTRAGLDLRPERPDGVFLFAGPTGVGKTELAKAICHEVFGSADSLIRLDMSEYSHDWAVSRLTGPQPGYVGFTEPDSWLTTRVAKSPQSLILLDEIEKAHRTVWNVFLQVFDAGRLSDSRGVTADFRSCIVVMTSNLGATTYGSQSLGFGSSDTQDDRLTEKITAAVRNAMPPELVNRLDAIAVFRSLDREVIRNIAEREVDVVVDRLRTRGYNLRLSRDVIDLLAATGYDPAFGARHLHRNIERILLQPLADKPGGTWQALRSGERIEWSPEVAEN